MNKICVVSGSRAEYGLLRPVIFGIQKSPVLELQLLVTGMHLSPEFGMTVKEIEKDGLPISFKVETMLSSDSPVGVSKSIGLGIQGFADVLDILKPDLILVLGDRYEIFSAVVSAMIAKIPVAHIHGGELTEGAIDDSIRHSITKMSHLHFVAAEEYRNRVIQLGEQPNRVFLSGGLVRDSLKTINLLDKKVLERQLKFKFGKRNLIVTYHPVTLEGDEEQVQYIDNLLNVLGDLQETNIIFTMPNSDMGNRQISKKIRKFCLTHPNCKHFKSLGQRLYFSCLNLVDGVVGNSSSGLSEVPSFRKGTVNIGNRQQGRLKASSVIDSDEDEVSIRHAIEKMYSSEFVENLKKTVNPYDGYASDKIISVIEKIQNFSTLLKKGFYDFSMNEDKE